jgi:hypothetical protein
MKSKSCGRIVHHVVLLITAMLLLPAPCSRGDAVEIQVTNQSGGVVECEVFLIDANGQRSSLGHTERGKLTTDKGCPNGCCLWFVPEERSTYYQDKTHCPLRNKKFTLLKISGETTQHLVAQVTDSPNDKKAAAESALAAKEVSDRAPTESIKQAYIACAQLQAGKFFGVENPLVYDYSRMQLVTTPKFDDCVRRYQAKEGLKPTGNLDYATLTKASGTTGEQLSSTPSDD